MKLLGRAPYEAEAGGTDHHIPDELVPVHEENAVPPQKPPRDKKKGVSFLSRIIGGKKKDQLSDVEDDVSEPDTARMDAAAQTIGFIPRFPRPPKYLRVRAHYKKEKTFNRVFVAQELEGAGEKDDAGSSTAGSQTGQHTGKAIWSVVFSNDGKYMATAGQDRMVRIWAVLASHTDREAAELDDEEEDKDQNDDLPKLKAPVFQTKPVQVFEGHTGSILDLSWSKNNFLLSSSMDRTVRLWHVTRPECLCCFQHSDFVTSIQFHPRDDRFFLAGSLDTKFRLWSIPDKSVAFVASVPAMVTAVAFTPDGRYAIAGCLNGLCIIYETDGLRPIEQIHVRSARGRNAKGSKITGIDTITLPVDDPNGHTKLLITSNDSRIRLYNFRDRTLEAKFRGNENTCSQIRATFCDDGHHVICGSEDRKTYIWPTGSIEKDTDKRAVEVFETHSSMVTAAVMVPTNAKHILGFSEDPIYDICNPPPVTLVSQADQESGNHHRNTQQSSPAYIARSGHPDGHIIIVADYSGRIKVLRQDCAYQKRRNANWDAHSSLSRRFLRRSNSARHSIASSFGKESSHKTTPSERILSWRNSVVRHGNGSTGSRSRTGTMNDSPLSTPNMSRYSSPGRIRSPRSSMENQQQKPRPQSTNFPSTNTRDRNNSIPNQNTDQNPGKTIQNNIPTTDKQNPLWLQGDQSNVYWNKITRDALAAQNRRSNLTPEGKRLSASERKLSTETKSGVGEALSSDEDGSGPGRRRGLSGGTGGTGGTGTGTEDEVLRCENCKGTNFRAKRARKGQRLVCVQCLRPADP